jgi:septum site-determining protein MinC
MTQPLKLQSFAQPCRMNVATATTRTSALELRGASLTLVAVVLKSVDLSVLEQELADRLAATPGLFDNDPVAIDFSRVRDSSEPIDFGALVALFRAHNLLPLAARGGTAEQMAAAAAAGLAVVPELPRAAAAEPPRTGKTSTTPLQGEPPLLTEFMSEPAPPARAPVTIVNKPVRSGQQVRARGDLVVLALVSYGAEVIAEGSIHVYAPLRGRAIAGVAGDRSARIYATHMQAQLVSIADVHGTGEAAVPNELIGRAAQVRLDGERLVVEALPC